MGDMVIYIRNVYVQEEKRKQVELFYLRLSIILAEIQWERAEFPMKF